MQDTPQRLSKQVTVSSPTLIVRNLRVTFHTYAGEVKAIDGIDITVNKHELLGLVGESGCGKSVTALAIAGLLSENARVESGEVLLDGVEILSLDEKELRHKRLTDLALVFQDPMTYLNPVMSIGTQLVEMFTHNLEFYRDELIDFRLRQMETEHDGESNSELAAEKKRLSAMRKREGAKLGRREGKRLAELRAMDYLRLVNLPDPERIMKMYPFELSGGMRQRAMIAMALVRRPKLLLADEITTALDVTVQAQVLELIKELRDKIDSSIILITHDLGIVAQTCDRVAVMYAGNVVELSPVDVVFKHPLHPYTKGLLAAIPKLNSAVGSDLESIKGSVPDLIHPPNGCRFHPRCPMAFEKCSNAKPPLIEANSGHYVACFLYGG